MAILEDKATKQIFAPDKDRMVWFCAACGAGNYMDEELDCHSCKSPITAEALVYNVDRGMSLRPQDVEYGDVPASPYFGGVSARSNRPFNAVWASDG